MCALRKGASCLLLLNRHSERSQEAEAKLRAEKTKSGTTTAIVAVDCDLQSFDSVANAARVVEACARAYGGLDGLVANAGVMGVPDTRTKDGFDVQIQTNHLSHFLLTMLLMPSLEVIELG